MTSTPGGSRRFNAGTAATNSHGGIVSIGNYRLSTTLGVGSFGKVKLAEHIITGHQVAVKILSKQKVKTLKMDKKIRREIQIMKLFRHLHIIKLYEVIETDQDILLIMEYVSGGELFEYIVAHGKMPEDKARRFFQQIIAAVEYCHAHMIVHRDLKPENLLLDDVNGSVKIADFGLSNVMEYGAFLKTSCGSPNYAAPEVISGSLYAGCFPTLDHQLLTTRGFMFAHDLLAAIDVDRDPRTGEPLVDARLSTLRVRDWRGLRVASYDSATGHLVYEQPRALIFHAQRSTAPPLVQFSSATDNSISVVATPNHNMYARLTAQQQFCKLSAAELARSAAPFQFLTLAANGVASSAVIGQKRRCCVHELPFARALGLRGAAQVDAFLELYGRWLVAGAAALLEPYAASRLALLGTTSSAEWAILVARVSERCDGDEWLWTQLDGELARRVVSGARGSADDDVVVANLSARDTLMRLALHAGLSGSFARCGERWRVSMCSDATVALSAVDGDVVRELSAAEMATYKSGATWCCTMPSGFVVTRRAVADAKGVVWRASRATIQGNSEVDVWSCGVILYALLNARLPFDNDHIPTLFKRIRSGEYSPPLCSPSCADLIQRCLCVDALKRITIPEIREHQWFKIDLPAYLAEPPRDVTELASLPIDDDVVAELQSMLGNDTVSYGEIQQALQQSVAADGTVNPLAVAYNLVYDQRMAADRTAPALTPTNSTGGAASSLSNPLLLATSPPMNLRLARPFVDVVPPASVLSPPQSSMMPMTQQFGDVSTGTSPTDEAIFSAKHMWFLGKMSRQAPIEIMREVYRVLQQCDFKWKVVSVYSLQVKCLHDVKISLQLYKISNQKHLLDFKKMSGPQLEFFDACNVILNSLRL